MDQETQNNLKQAWLSAPLKNKDVVLARTHSQIVQRAVASFGLDPEGVASLELEVLFVLLGLQTIAEFEEEVSQRSVLTAEQAGVFITSVRDNLFTGLVPALSWATQEAGPKNQLATISAALETYGLVRERLERLPHNVQATIRSQAMEDALRSLIAKHRLSPEHTTAFVAEATRVMVGLTTTNNFKTEVTRVTALDPNTLDALFLDTETTLFKPVRMAIMQALEQRGVGQAQSTVPAPVPKPAGQTPSRDSVGTSPLGGATSTSDPYREPIR